MSKKYMFLPAIFLILLFLAYVNIASTSNQNERNNSSTESINENDFKNDKLTDANNATIRINPPSNMDTITFQNEMLESSFASPEFMNDELIAFSIRDSNQFANSYIITIHKENMQLQQIYQANENKIINSLVGINDQLYWVEYPAQNQIDTEWSIKTLDLTSNEVHEFRKGISKDQMDPPVLRIYDQTLTWIEKELQDDIVTSSAWVHNPSSEESKVIATTRLNEKDRSNRKGVFLNIQRPVNNGVMIHRSVFEQTDDEHIKFYDLVFYPYQNTEKPIVLLSNAENVVDFTADEQWIVICKFGKVFIYNRDNMEIEYEITGEDLRLTFDSPYIMDNDLYVRYSMTQIFRIDLSNGMSVPITEPRPTTSKIFNSKGKLGFSYKQAVDPTNSGEIEFTIIGD